MILRCNFEELGALRKGANELLGESSGAGLPVLATGLPVVATSLPVVAPPEGREEVTALLPRLTGDLAMETLADQQRVLKGLSAIVAHLREELDEAVLATHPADESAVASYFLFAHALGVLRRAIELGQEMEALIEVVTGAPASQSVAATFQFPH